MSTPVFDCTFADAEAEVQAAVTKLLAVDIDAAADDRLTVPDPFLDGQ